MTMEIVDKKLVAPATATGGIGSPRGLPVSAETYKSGEDRGTGANE